MKGSEKQIKWAEDIKTAVITTIDNLLAAAANDPRCNTEDAKDARAKMLRARDAVAACEDAHDLIEVYGSLVSARNSDKDNARGVIAKIRNRFMVQYDTPAQQALIGE